MYNLLKNKTAVITGANRGIGKKIFETFAYNGANIILCTRKKSKEFVNFSNKIKKKYKVLFHIIELDLGNEISVNNAIKEIYKFSKKIDILVNNAGIASGSLFQMTPISKIKNLFEINFFNQILFTQGICKIMIRNKSGSIIFLSSISSHIADSGTLAYGTSKAAITRAARSMATELGKYNIRVNIISPGVVKTDMYDEMSEDSRKKLINSSIMKRAAKPEEVANLALFLSSDLSEFITGQEINIDGGII